MTIIMYDVHTSSIRITQ